MIKLHDGVIKAKLAAATPHILAKNRELTTAMLEFAKPIVAAETPWGPGHFGYHGRDTLRIEVKSVELKTIGKLLGAVQLYWRERGTQASAMGRNWGEKPRWTAKKAINKTRRFISFYYNGMANWWRI